METSNSGRIFGNFIVQQRLTHDAVSAVFHAHLIDDASALTTLRVARPAGSNGITDDAVREFLKDAEAAGQIWHPHVLQTYRVGQFNKYPYVAMRPIEALSLHTFLREHAPLSPRIAVALLRPIAAALDAAGEAGLAHGAVHPRTIWIQDTSSRLAPEQVFLTGFGLHHLLQAYGRHHRDSDAVDDVLYIAPEQLRGKSPDVRSDQYALACALYHCLTGSPPFEKDTLRGLYGAHLFASPPAMEDDRVPSAGSLNDVLHRALAKDPAERFPSCEAFLDAAEPWLQREQGSSPVAASITTSQAPAEGSAAAGARRPRPAIRDALSPGVLGGLGVVAVVALAAVLWGVLSSAPDEVESAQPVSADVSPPSEPEESAEPAEDTPWPDARWQAEFDQPVTAMHLTSDGLVTATGSGLTVLAAEDGAVRWEADADLGPSPDLAVSDDVVAFYDDRGVQAITLDDGSERWNSAADLDGMRADANAIYGIGNDGSIPQIIAADARSGEELWHFPDGAVAFSEDVVAAAGDDFVYLVEPGFLYGILPKGAAAGETVAPEPLCLWRVEITDGPWDSALTAVDGGVLMASEDGDVCLYGTNDGAQTWCTTVTGVEDAAPTVLATDELAVVVTPRSVTALELDSGRELWSETGNWTGIATIHGRELFIASRDGAVHSLNLKSGEKETAEEDLGEIIALAADADGLYVATADNSVLALPASEARSRT